MSWELYRQCMRIARECRGEDLNLHGLLHTLLKRACLPFHHPGLSVVIVTKEIRKNYICNYPPKLLAGFVCRRFIPYKQKNPTVTPARETIGSTVHSTDYYKFVNTQLTRHRRCYSSGRLGTFCW